MEESSRLAVMKEAAINKKNVVIVPYLATIPSRLTFMLNPEHDKHFITTMAARQGIPEATHDSSQNATKPYTLNTLKKIKNLL